MDKSRLGLILISVPLVLGLGAAIGIATVEASPWFAIGIPIWIGVLLIYWNDVWFNDS